MSSFSGVVTGVAAETGQREKLEDEETDFSVQAS
jgi:hypothetical protein